jgi:ABC-2 type transport system permease protein
MRVLKSLTRILAFVGKEIVEVTRRPGAIISLILGPFIIMAIFGVGYSGVRRPLQTVVVIPPNAGLPTSIEDYKSLSGPWFEITAVTGDQAAAEGLLAERRVDLVVVAPQDLRERFRANEQSIIQVKYNTVDPVLSSYAAFLSLRLSDEVNREIIERAAAEGEQYAIGAGASQAAAIDPAVIAAPTRTETSNIAPSEPKVIPYFGPAVLALILQHMAVTLIALSLTRERLSGVKEIFRVAPVHTIEILLGKLVAFGLLNALVAGATIALLVGVLKIPVLGDPVVLVGVVALLILASLGVGLVISLVSDSERQAVQLSLLLLLASVFFSGFVLAIDEFAPAVRNAAYALPVTHGIRLTQDLMLRGATNAPWQIGALGGISAVLLLASWILLRRDMSRA